MKKRIDNEKLLETLEFGIGDNAVSHYETTGLIPFAPENNAQLHSYKEINKYQEEPITK